MGALKGSTATVASITQELAANGSVVGTMDVYDDFLYYSSGVYKVKERRRNKGGMPTLLAHGIYYWWNSRIP